MSNYNKNNPQTIQAMFNSIAKRYDLTNAVLSFYLHKYWNRQLLKRVITDKKPKHFLDLCSGTGDIALEYLKHTLSPTTMYLIDFCPAMLACAQEKSQKLPFLKPHQLQFIEADVQALPLKNGIGDCATMAYGIRNVKDPLLCLREVFRVLKSGGTFGILELTEPCHSLIKWGHQIYLKTMLPLLGKWLTDNEEAYKYLKNSIHTFIPPEELRSLLQQVGFQNTSSYALAGGIATIFVGHKPLAFKRADQ